MVRATGLEPVRQRHTPLKRACLPVPARSQLQVIIYHDNLYMSTTFYIKILNINISVNFCLIFVVL